MARGRRCLALRGQPHVGLCRHRQHLWAARRRCLDATLGYPTRPRPDPAGAVSLSTLEIRGRPDENQAPSAESPVISAHQRLVQIDKASGSPKSELQAGSDFHHGRESREAHLTVVLGAAMTSRFIEAQTGWRSM